MRFTDVGTRRQSPSRSGPNARVSSGREPLHSVEAHRSRRHRDADVAGGDGERGFGVATLVGVDEPGQDLSLLIRHLRHRPIAPPCRQALLERRPRPLDRAVRGRDARAEVGGGLGRRPPQHIPGDQRRSLPRRQGLQRGDERQLDRLALDDDVIGRLVEQRIGIRLEPRDLGERPRSDRLARPLAQRVDAGVGGDPVQPRTEVLTTVEVLAAVPRPQERLLDDVLGIVERRQHPVAVHVQLPAVAGREPSERRLVAGEGGVERVGLSHHSRSGLRALTSCSNHPLPSGSLNVANEP